MGKKTSLNEQYNSQNNELKQGTEESLTKKKAF